MNISMMVLPLVGLSLPLLFSKNPNRNNWGSVIIGFSIIFIGLDFLNHSTPDINNNPGILEFLTNFSDYGFISIILYVVIGAILTMILQSSSAVMALTLVICFNGWISYEMAAAMVLGQNIGTTITANLAALVANTSAKRTAMAHLFFNLIGVVIILPFLYPLLRIIANIGVNQGLASPIPIDGQTAEQTAAAIPIALAVFHTVFNIGNTLILIWFVKPIEKIITKIIKQKDEEEEFKLQYISTGLLSTIDLSILQARKELMVFTSRVEKMFKHTHDILDTNSSKKINSLMEKFKKNEMISDQFEVEITAYLAEVSKQDLSTGSAEIINRMLQITTQIESIADACYAVSKNVCRKVEGKIKFRDSMEQNLLDFYEIIDKQFEMMMRHVRNPEMETDVYVTKLFMKEIRIYYNQLQQEHFKCLKKGDYKTKTGVVYADIYAELLRIGDLSNHVVRLLSAQEGIKHD
jgi:phosphate:Na+ symporter